jgi:DNA-binding IclR family transcriptional regulator
MSGSVQKAFKILDYISLQTAGATLTEIARDLDLNKATALRYIKSLRSLRILERRQNQYHLGLRLFEIGSRVRLQIEIRQRVHGILENLCHRVNETVNLAQIHNAEVLYLDKIESTRSLQIQTNIGGTAPVHCTALGKAILSIMPDHQRNLLMKRLSFDRKTRNTLSGTGELNSQILEIRRQGYSVDHEELEEGLKCVAVPFRIDSLNFYGGISLSGPSIRFTRPVIRKYAGYLLRVRDQVVDQIRL